MTARPHASAVTFCGTDLLLYGAGYLYLPDHKMLVVSDLHLEKGAAQSSGLPLPAYDTDDTVRRLESACARLSPKTCLFLGDSFHNEATAFRINYQPLQPSVSSSGSPETMIRTSLRFCLVKAVIAISVTGWFSAMR